MPPQKAKVDRIDSIKYNRIAIILKEKSLSQYWLSIKIGVDRSTVSRWCSNELQPTMENLFKITKVLDVMPGDLLNSDEIFIHSIPIAKPASKPIPMPANEKEVNSENDVLRHAS